MLISFLKISSLFLLLLFVPVICNAEDDSAPAKFYDGLPIEAEKAAAINKVDDSEVLERELDLAIAKRKHIAVKKLAHRNKFSIETESNQDLDANKNAKTESYVVGKNQSLSAIAARFKVAPKQRAAQNAIALPNQLHVGQKLKIFKNKQKHSSLKSVKKQSKTAEISRDNSQKTSIISINNKNMLKFYCHWPTRGKIIKNFSQTGGRGIEMGGRTGQAIKATAAGKVVAVSPGIYGHGGFIVIEHADRVLSSYANNSRSLVKNDQSVIQGQIIAEMGRVGRKPPSLEFEIRKNGVLVDPMRCLPKKI